MRRAVVVAFVLLLVAPAGGVSAERHTVTRPVASVRSAPGSFAIGHVFAGARVDVIASRGRWVYAAWGDDGRCGWLLHRGLRPAGAVSSPVCPPDLPAGQLFAAGSYQLGCGEGCVFPARVVRCADRTVYANYLAGAFTDPVGTARVFRGTRGRTVPRYAGVRSGYSGFGVRYVTRDGVAALIKDSRAAGPVWRFIRAECVERLSLVVSARGLARPRRAIRTLGTEWVGSSCLMQWARPSVTIAFDGCRRFAWALISRQRIHGSALVHTWTTREGLRLGDRLSRLRRLYPGARRFRGTYRVAPGVRVVVQRGRVGAFRVTPAVRRSSRRPPARSLQ